MISFKNRRKFPYYTLIFIFFYYFLFSVVNQGEEFVGFDALVERNGIFYNQNSLNPYTGNVKGLDDFGLFVEGNIKNGKFHGRWKSFWDNGNLQWEGVYEEGKITGKATWYEINGDLVPKR
tara:strand:- start:248 stop:610 length:363 start_codon:yes stop_codon:yes gene_type:complete